VITEPGVYDIPHERYLADPVPAGSLSSSGARRLLPPSCPAKFRWWADNPEPPKPHYEHGHGAHKYVLGVGPELVIVEADNWKTKAAQEAQKKARAEGKVPLLREQHDRVKAMAAKLHEHPKARWLFAAGHGMPEQSLFWTDRQMGVWRRARLDWLPDGRAGRMYLPDYKTADSAARDAIEKAIYSYGYHQQGAWYVDAVTALGLAAEVVFLLAVQEKTPPYLVNVIEVDPEALRVGRDLNRQALEIFRDCLAAGRWPGYDNDEDEIPRVGLPPWAMRRYMQEVW
jgi:hypothetical protein